MKADILCFKDRIRSCLFLFFIVLEGIDRNLAQQHARRQIDQCHAAHGDIRHGPGSVHRYDGPEKDDQNTQTFKSDPELPGGLFFTVQVDQGIIDVIQVADQGREREQEHGDGNEDRPDHAKHG